MAILWITGADTMDPAGPIGDWAARTASWVLYKLTAEKYSGLQSATEYYSLDSSGDIRYSPVVIQGEIYNLPKGQLTFGNTRLRLRHQPVRSVSEVTLGSTILDPSAYELRNNAFLTRSDKLPWILFPQQEMSVTYNYGTKPPVAGRRAALRFANELIMAETSDSNCALPDSVTAINRQGVSYTLLDPQVYVDKGKTGIYEIDMFIHSANPRGALKKPQVYVAGRPSGERIN